MKRLNLRIVGILLSLALLMTLLPVSALSDEESTDTWCSATGGKHSWKEWTVTKEPTCTASGERTRECGRCHYVQTETLKKLKHDYGKWKTTVEATCTQKGEQKRTCKVCKHVETRETDKLPHTWSEWTVTKEATCTETGLREHTCKVCGQTKEEKIKTLPHTWSDWEVIVAATDHTRGTRARTCQVCGTQETEDFDPEGTIRRGAKGDAVRRLQEDLICYGALKEGGADGSFGKGTERAIRAVQEAEGLEADGVAWPQTLALLGHRFGEWQTISKLTRTTDGVRERVCARCGLVERDVVEAKPVIKRGQKGKPVEVIQGIIWDLGYNPGKIDGVYGPKLDAAIVEWARDNDWYYEPGLLKPIDIDRIVGAWTRADDGIGISGATTPVNLKITVTRDFNMFLVYPGQSLKFNYTVTNMGTEDCTLGPLFLGFGEKKSYESDKVYYRYVGDLSGEALKAGGANSYSGSFTVTADTDIMVLDDPQMKHYALYVNAWVLGTSKADGGKWYSNIDQQFVNMFDPEETVNPKLVLSGRVLNERPWYTQGDKLEYEVTLQNDTGEDLQYANVRAAGYFSEGVSDFMYDQTGPIPSGGTWSETYTHVIDTNDAFFDGQFPFWLEATGVTAGEEDIIAPQVSLSVNTRHWVDVADGRLTLSRKNGVAEDVSYAAGETWSYRYRVENTGDAELHDVEIRAYLDAGAWHPLDEKAVGTLLAGGYDDLAGERVTGSLYTVLEDPRQDSDGKWIYSHIYRVVVVATGVTPDGELIHAEPFEDWVHIDFDDDERFQPRGLQIEAHIVDQKGYYVDGEEFEYEVSLKNLSGEPLTECGVALHLFTADKTDGRYPDGPDVDGVLAPGQTWTKRFKLNAERFADTDEYEFCLHGYGQAGEDEHVDSDTVRIPLTIMPLKEQDKHSLPVGGYSGISLRKGPTLRNGGKKPRVMRSLTVAEQTAVEDAYYDGAVIPVLMRLTIDDADQYDFLGVEPAPGDSVSDEPWMHETLLPGESYDFTYTVVIDPETTGWDTRDVTARLSSYSTGFEEYESCEVRPPFKPAKVTIVAPDAKTKAEAELSLTVDKEAFHGQGCAGDLLDIPFNAACGGNVAIKDIKLLYEETVDGAHLTEGEMPVVYRMDPGDSLDLLRQIMLIGVSDNYAHYVFKLKLRLAGTFLNAKGKQETVESEPVELPLTVLEMPEGRAQLSLTGQLDPQKNAYAPGDKVKIRLRVENHVGADLNNVIIDPAWPCDDEWADLKGKHTVPSLNEGTSSEIEIDYTVRVDDLKKDDIKVTFAARGTRLDNGEFEYSPGKEFVLHIEDEPQQTLNFYVVEKKHAESYPPGAKVPVEFSYRNGPLSAARFYAVGDNSAPVPEYGGNWHSFGHGMKGYQCYEEKDVAPTMGWHRIDTFVQIPADFDGETFSAAWIIEADDPNSGKACLSNVAALELPVGAGLEEQLTLNAYPEETTTDIPGTGRRHCIHTTMRYEGPVTPDNYTYRYRLKGTDEWKTYEIPTQGQSFKVQNFFIKLCEADIADGGWTYELDGFDTARPELAAAPVEVFFSAEKTEADDIWGDEPVPDGIDDDGLGPDEMPGDEPVPDWVDDGEEGPDGLPGDEPVPDWVDDGEEGPDGLPGDEPVPDWVDDGEEEPVEGAPLENVSLDVDLLTPCPNPATGDWFNGDKVKFQVLASYNGGVKVPVRIEVCVTDAVETAEPLKVMSASNSSYLLDTCEIDLDVSHAVSGKCVYDFVAYVYLYDEDHVEDYSETVPYVFDMAPGGMGPDSTPIPEPEPSPEPAAMPAREGAPVFRSLTVAEQTKDEDAYYDGAEIPVRMRLTVDSYDEYDCLGIQSGPGDSVSDPAWMNDVLKPGMSYDFGYTMVLDPQNAGWKPRSVTVRLRSRTTGAVETESCEVRPPFTNPTVSFGKLDSGASIINDYDAYLYLTLGVKSLTGYRLEQVAVPFSVELYSTTGTVVRNLKLCCETDADGKPYYLDTRGIAQKIEGSAVRSYATNLPIRYPESGNWSCEATFYVTGEYYDKNDKVQTVESERVTVPIVLQRIEDRPGSLRLTYEMEPFKDLYAANDSVEIRLKARNNGETALDDVSIHLTEAFKSIAGELNLEMSKIDKTHLEPGETATVTCTYHVSPADARKGEFEFSFAATGTTTMTRQTARSFNQMIRAKVDKKVPEDHIALTAFMSDNRERYPVDTPMSCYVAVKNGTAQQVSSVRVYAVGDNRFEGQYSDAPVSDMGHGAKGPLAGSSGGIKSGGSLNVFMKVTIPQSFGGKGPYCPAWIAEVTMADGTKLRSDIAGLSLRAVPESLALTATLDGSEEEPRAVDESVTVHVELEYTGDGTPKDYIIYWRPIGKAADWYEAYAMPVGESHAEADIILPMREAEKVKNGWKYLIQAKTVTRASVPSNQCVFEFKEKESAEAGGSLDLQVEQLTQMPDPKGWHDGDTVKFKVKAVYTGPKMPGSIQADAKCTNASVAQVWKSVDNVWEFSDELEVDLDATRIVDGACSYVINAYAVRPDGGGFLDFKTSDVFTFPMDMSDPDTAEVLQNGAIALSVLPLVGCTDPDGYWHDGDEVPVSVMVLYKREKAPQRLDASAYDGKGNIVDGSEKSTFDESTLSYECTLHLKEDQAVDGKCVFNFIGRAFVTTMNVPDYKSDFVSLAFDMAVGGKGPDEPAPMPAEAPAGLPVAKTSGVPAKQAKTAAGLSVALQPVGGAISHADGESITLTVEAQSGAAPYTYEWHYETTAPGQTSEEDPVVGEDSPSFTTTEGGKRYYCIMTDAEGNKVRSESAAVESEFFIAEQPEDANLYGEDSVTLTCRAAGGTPFDGVTYLYAWYNAEGALVGFSADGTAVVSEEGEYHCDIQDFGNGFLTSNTVTVYSEAP